MSKLNEQAQKDAQLARELALSEQDEIREDAEYIAKRDAQFARNIQKMESRYHATKAANNPQAQTMQPSFLTNGPVSQDPFSHSSHTHQQQQATATGTRSLRDQNRHQDLSFHDLQGGLQYNDEQYQVKLARLAVVTDEPLYANQRNKTTDLNTSASTEEGDRSTIRSTTSATTTTSTASSSTSSRSRSSVASTGYSEMGACGGAAALVPEVAAYPNEILGEK